jgi:hypothetical protein
MVATESLNKSVETNTNLMGMFSYLKNTVINNVMGAFGALGSITIILQIMVNKLRNMMNRITGIYKTVFSILQTAHITAESTWEALPGRLLRALPAK